MEHLDDWLIRQYEDEDEYDDYMPYRACQECGEPLEDPQYTICELCVLAMETELEMEEDPC